MYKIKKKKDIDLAVANEYISDMSYYIDTVGQYLLCRNMTKSEKVPIADSLKLVAEKVKALNNVKLSEFKDRTHFGEVKRIIKGE